MSYKESKCWSHHSRNFRGINLSLHHLDNNIIIQFTKKNYYSNWKSAHILILYRKLGSYLSKSCSLVVIQICVYKIGYPTVSNLLGFFFRWLVSAQQIYAHSWMKLGHRSQNIHIATNQLQIIIWHLLHKKQRINFISSYLNLYSSRRRTPCWGIDVPTHIEFVKLSCTMCITCTV